MSVTNYYAPARLRVAEVARIAPLDESPAEVFVGRDDQVSDLLAALAPSGNPAPVVVSAVAGMGGVGKTALARHCAAVAVQRGWFPGGAFLVDLQGYSPDGHVEAAAVFPPLLRRLGLPAEQIPVEAGQQIVVYDQLLATLAGRDRRVLVVLDNISAASQVRGLLPSGPHRAIVTTRDALNLPGTRRLPLDVLDEPDAVDLLNEAVREQHPDDDRISRSPKDAARLAHECGRLPLALRIAAALLTDDPDLTPAELAAELAEASVDAFAHGESKVTTVFDRSWHRLTQRDPAAARVLSLLPLDPGPDLSTEAAAALAGQPIPQTRTHLRTAQQTHLLQRINGRWRLHDLVRRYLRDRAANEAEAATTRLLDHYTQTADAADKHMRALPGRPVPDRFANRDAALAWLDTERANLVASVTLAATAGHHQHTTRLAAALNEYLLWRRQLTDRVTAAQHALNAATHLNELTLANAWTYLGLALQEVRRSEEAVAAHGTARDIYRETGGRHSEGIAWNNLGLALRHVRRFEEAVAAHGTARDIYRETGDRHGEGGAWNNLGLVLREMQLFDEARSCLLEAITVLSEVGDDESVEQIRRRLDQLDSSESV